MKMAEKIQPIKPKFKELIPIWGFMKYYDRCFNERLERSTPGLELDDIVRPELSGDYHMLGMLTYTAIVGGATLGTALTLIYAGIEYITM